MSGEPDRPPTSGTPDGSLPSAAPVRVDRDGHVLVVTIDRPRVRNAIDRATAEAVAAAMDRLDQDPELRVGVLTGAGGTFSAGMDLKAFARGESTVTESRGFAGLVARPPTKPLIAAVEGWALGGGFEIVLACDLVVAAEDATFGLPEVKRGLTPAAGGLFRLPTRIPYHHAMRLVLIGEPLPARRAAELGLVIELTPTGEALPAALRLAATIAANAPLAVAAAKRTVVESADWTLAESFARQAAISGPVHRSEDAKEGARAFLEKRTPVWTGR